MTKYFLIYQSGNVDEIGRIVRINANENIESFVKEKRFAQNLSFSEISFQEYKYYTKVDQSKRVKCMEDGLFAKICSLRPGDLCKAEMDKKFLRLKMIKNESKLGDTILKCKAENGSIIDVPAHCIYDITTIRDENKGEPGISGVNADESRNRVDVQEAPITDGYYLLTKRYCSNEPGTLFRVRNGDMMTIPYTSAFMNRDGLKEHLVKLEKDEAEFLQKYSIDKRMKRYEQQRFRIMKDLPLGQECHLRKDKVMPSTYVIRNKNIQHDGVKYDLSYKKNSLNVRSGVDMFDIKLDKEFWKTRNNPASSLGRRMSKTSGSSLDDQATGKSGKLEYRYCGPIELNVIDPFKITKVDEDRHPLNKYIVIFTNRRFIVRLLWKGLVDDKICLGCELLTDWLYGTNGEFKREQLFCCKDKRGVLIPLEEGDTRTCERVNDPVHKLLNDNEIVAEEQICCVELNPSFESNTKWIGKSIIFSKEAKESDIKWHGLVNGKECLGISCSKRVESERYKRDGIVDVLTSKKFTYNLDQFAIIQVNDIPKNIYCDPIELNVINPFAIMKEDRNDGNSLDKYIEIFTEKTFIVRLLWKGLVDDKTCLGCELLTDWPYGTNGEFKGEQLFKCNYKRGVLIPLEEGVIRTCERANDPVHKLLNDNEIVAEEQICCVESKKDKSRDIEIGKTTIFRRQPKPADVKWQGLVNGKECLGIIGADKVERERYKKDGIVNAAINMTSQNLKKMAIIQLNDTHIEFVQGVFVANANNVRDWIPLIKNGFYDIGQLIEVAPFYGRIECFIEDFPLVAIRLDKNQIRKHHEFLQQIMFQEPFFQKGYQGVLVKKDLIQKFKEEFRFMNNSWAIDPFSIKYQTESQSERFAKNEFVKSVFDGSTKYFKIHDFALLNESPCLKVVKAISDENCSQYEYLREEDVHKANISEIKTKCYLDIFLDPRSIVIVEELQNDEFAVGDKVGFRSRMSEELYRGTVQGIVKVNGILSSIVELATKVDETLKKYELKENKELNHLCINIDSLNFIIPLNILMKLQEQIEIVKDIYMVNPQTVKTYRGKNPKEKFIIFKCNGKKHCALLKWKGYINDKIYCLGCEIKRESGLGSYGTNGTFGGHNLFRCINGCGVLIPMDRLGDCCVKDGHRELILKRERIDEDSICCIKTTEKSILNTRINIHERIKKRSSKEIGVFRWVGLVNNKEVIGIDSNNLIYPGTDGSFCGVRLFDCNPKCGALFEPTAFEYELKLLAGIKVNIIDPFNVSVIENGKEIRKLMYLNFKEKQPINIRWRGCIDGYLCVGCELANETEYGTNGTFAGQTLFTCGDRKGVLIPIEELRERCELGDHKDIVKIDKIMSRLWKGVGNFINPDHICCVEWLSNIKRWPKLGIDGKMKYGSSEVPAICRWIGLVNGKEAVGVEMDIEFKGSNGRFAVFDLFTCPNGRGALFLADDIVHDIENEKLHFIDDKIVDVTKIYNIKQLNVTCEKGISIGDPVIMKIPLKNHVGEVKWMGVINNEKCVGLDMEDLFDCAMDGIIKDKLVFKCLEGHGLVTPLTNVKLSEDSKRPHIMENGILNPNKYLKYEEQWNKPFLEERNIQRNGFVFVVMKTENSQVKMKGTLRWCGLINQMPMAAVELTEDHEYGTDGTFWRHQLFKCPDKLAIAAPWNSIYQYLPYEQKVIPNEDRIFPEIDINSAVKYYLGCNDEVKDLYGTVKWSGIDEYGAYFYGLELDDRLADGTDGTFKGLKLFQCRYGHGILAPLDCVNKDLRFVEKDVAPEDIPASNDSEKIHNAVLSKLVEGVNKGIQGNANSCYFDSAIFALFSTSDVLDFMISPNLNGIEEDKITKEFREIIAWKIIYPLREFGFVSFHKTSEMRNVITKYGPKFEEMTKQESDMENVSALLAKLCPNEQLLSIKSYTNCKNNSMFLQLFLILNNKIDFMTSEQMLKVSMIQNEIMFDELPACLIMQAPRDARGINCYKYVLPSNIIEISQICSNYFKKCSKCESEAKYQCKDCLVFKGGLDILASYQCDNHKCRHENLVNIPETMIKSRSKVFMELKAIICIEKCHFVAYVKQEEVKSNDPVNRDKLCKWYFFDSMSTQSISNNYALPKVTFSKEVSHFLNLPEEAMKNDINAYSFDDIKRIVNDSYIFVYHNPAKTCY